MSLSDYEQTKENCVKPQIKYDPGLKENPVLTSRYFQMAVYNIHHNCMYMHWHSYLEIVYFNSGEAACYIDGRSFPVTEGDILFVNSGQIHAAYSTNNTNIEFVPIIFDKSLFARYSGDPYFVQFMMPFLEDKLEFPNLIRPDMEHYADIKKKIFDVIREFEEKSLGYEMFIRCHLQELIIELSRAYGFKKRGKKKIDIGRSDQFKKLFDYIEAHYQEKISVKQAAEIVYFSTYHFCKIFKEMTGLTFVEFLNLNRVIAAEELLCRTELSITEITERTGFCNINYFDKVFKQYKGYPPSKCRN